MHGDKMQLKLSKTLWKFPLRRFRQWQRVGLFVLVPTAVAIPSQSTFGSEGFTAPSREVTVSSPESGIVERLVVREGQKVAAGETLVLLDHRVHEAHLAVADADRKSRGRVEVAKAEMLLRQHRLEALERLLEDNNARQEEVTRARTDRDIAAANLAAAQDMQRIKELEFARIQAQLDRRTIRAPCEGIITETFKEEGEYVGAGDPRLMNLVQLDPLTATFDVSRASRATEPWTRSADPVDRRSGLRVPFDG